jgi:hypothetical protein
MEQCAIHKTNSMEEPVRVCDKVIRPAAIKAPALRRMICELAGGDRATLVSCRHKDWSQQGQCGCAMGCLGG